MRHAQTVVNGLPSSFGRAAVDARRAERRANPLIEAIAQGVPYTGRISRRGRRSAPQGRSGAQRRFPRQKNAAATPIR
ncbi:MAG: hypothetical protein ACLUI3_02610 [Christensenellales bacterium]